jgi:hypothetical protein
MDPDESDLYDLDDSDVSSDDPDLGDFVSSPSDTHSSDVHPQGEAASLIGSEEPSIDWKLEEHNRKQRDFALMSSLDLQVANAVFGPTTLGPPAIEPVVKIQAFLRGWQGRQEHMHRLFVQFKEEEMAMQSKQRRQMEEGLMVLDSRSLEQKLSDNVILRREESNQRHGGAYVIQRACLRFLNIKRKQSIASHWVAVGNGSVALAKDLILRQASPPEPPPT